MSRLSLRPKVTVSGLCPVRLTAPERDRLSGHRVACRHVPCHLLMECEKTIHKVPFATNVSPKRTVQQQQQNE